jgi:NarL family two-component system response regulator LiaR
MQALIADPRRNADLRKSALTALQPRPSSNGVGLYPSPDRRSSVARSPHSPIRVVIIDDQGVVRKGIRVFLESDGDIKVVGEAESGENGIALVHDLKPDVVVLDVMMPGMDGVTAATAIRLDSPTTEIIALSSAVEHKWIVGMIRAGAIGYLPKTVKIQDLCRAIHAVASGQIQLAPEAAEELMHEMRAPVEEEPLTPRELDVLHHLASGLSNKEIARCLYITEKTVKTHMSNIIAKMGVESRTQAALVAVQKGIVSANYGALAS